MTNNSMYAPNPLVYVLVAEEVSVYLKKVRLVQSLTIVRHLSCAFGAHDVFPCSSPSFNRSVH